MIKFGIYNKYESKSEHLINFFKNDFEFEEDIFMSGWFFRTLYEVGLKENCSIQWIQTTLELREFDYIIFSNAPSPNDEIYRSAKSSHKSRLILIVTEPKVVVPQGHNVNFIKNFSYVFTFNDDLIASHDNVYKFNLPQPLRIRSEFIPLDQRKDMVLVGANKPSHRNRQSSLHNIKIQLIRNLESSKVQIDIFGPEWKQAKKYPKIKKLLFWRYRYYNFKSLRGYTNNKLQEVANYKFSLVLENSEQNGYISEKIFEAMFSYAVPIYYGAPNIENYVPIECFIHARKFDNNDQLINYVKNLTLQEIENYIQNAQKFLSSDEFLPFLATTNANNIFTTITREN